MFFLVPGAVHTKDFRTPGCINYGNGSQIVTLGINLLAPQGAPDYCGVFVNNVSISYIVVRAVLSAAVNPSFKICFYVNFYGWQIGEFVEKFV